MPQLRMWFDGFASVPPLVVPQGFALRRFGEGDEPIWSELLHANGELGEWSVERAKKVIVGEGETGVFGPGIHLLESIGERRAVATACVQQRAETLEVPELGWVAVRPDMRGRGLGRVVSLAVLHFMQTRGTLRCYLNTDDHRLPAIKLYLKLGFVPDMSDPSYATRWAALWTRLRS